MVDTSPPIASPLIEVRRSARRRRTVSAYRDGEKIVILMPARMTKAAERRLVTEMVQKVTSREATLRSRGPRASDRALLVRSAELASAYLDGRAQPTSVRWVTNMAHRWGSCTPSDGTIRLSHRLQSMPSWVIDYVLIHELAHLLEPGHGPTFWSWADRYPRTERARGFLEGIAMAAQSPDLSSFESSEDCDSDGGSSWTGSLF
jgi:predicted metal-dependent hydrolase